MLLLTKRKLINSDGFFTSLRLLIAVVFELKLLLLQERFPFLVLMVLGSCLTYIKLSSWG